MKTRNIIFVAAMATLFGGCASTASQYRPIVDGPDDARYQQEYEMDLADCQGLAETRAYDNGEVRTEAAMGAVVGAVVGAAEEGSDGAIGGAVLGALLTGGGRAWETREERKEIVLSCMEKRGHRVVG